MQLKIEIRKNDQVRVLAGRDKGQSGRVLEVLREKNRLIVENINKIKRHVRPNPAKQIRGGILEEAGTIHVSNVALVCSDCGPTRIKHQTMAGGAKKKGRTVRACAKCGKVLDN